MAGPGWMQRPHVVTARERSRVVDLLLDMLAGWREHRTGRNAALLAHHGFLSVFPLVVAFTTVLGFVLQGNKDLRADIVDSALTKLPVIGDQVAEDPSRIQGSIIILVLGLAASLWSGMKAFVGLQTALDDIGAQPLDARANLVITRLRALLGIAIVGGAQIGTAIITSFVGVASIPGVSRILLALSAVAVNTAVLAASYRWLRARRPEWREVLPGAVIGGVVFSGLQLFGTTVVSRAIANASPVYGTFASVIGLLTWLSLHATVALAGAELNQALSLRNDSSMS